MATTFEDAMNNFSDSRHDGVMNISHYDDKPSAPADVDAAMQRYALSDGEAQIVREKGPGFLQRAKLTGKRVLALTGVAVVSAGAAYGATEAADDVYTFSGIGQQDPVIRELTPAQKEEIMNRPYQNELEAQIRADGQ